MKRFLVIAVAALAICYLLSLHSFLLFHSVVETLMLVVAITIFSIGWNARRFTNDNLLLLLALGYLSSGILGGVHMLAYKGMGVFPGYDADLPTQLWIAARYAESLSILTALYFLGKPIKLDASRLLLISLGITVLLLFLIFGGYFPSCFVEGSGLTNFKIISEYVIIALFGVSLWMIRRNSHKLGEQLSLYLTTALVLSMVAEFFFTLYVSVYGLSNFLGHVFKLLAFYYIYLGVVRGYISDPYHKLERERDFADTVLETISSLIVILDLNWRIVRVNKAFEETMGLSAAEVKGRPFFDLIPMREEVREAKECYELLIGEHIDSGEKSLTNWIRGKEGKQFLITWSLAFLRDTHGLPSHLVQYGKDVTDHYEAERQLRIARDILETTQDGFFIVNTQGQLMDVNDAYCQMSGYTKEEVLGLSVYDLDVGQTPEEIAEKIDYISKHRLLSFEAVHQKRDGSIFDVEMSTKWLGAGDGMIVCFCRDITERKKTERAIQSRLDIMMTSVDYPLDSLLQLIVDQACDISGSPIGFFHVVSGRTLTLKAWSTRTLAEFCNLGTLKGMEYSLEKAGVWADCVRQRKTVIHNDYSSLPHRKGLPDGHAGITRQLVVPILRQQEVVAILGVGNKILDYTERDVQMIEYFANTAWEILERKQAEDRIKHMSFHDNVTNLYNRAYLEEEIRRLDTGRHLPLSIIMADLNGLKLVNDTYGHHMGDELLKDTADILRRVCREEDIIARWGGDEFVILLPRTPIEGAEAISKRIQEECQKPSTRAIPTSIALGSATKSSRDEFFAQTLKRAEDNMYKQKLVDKSSAKNALLKAFQNTLKEKSFETEDHVTRMQNTAHGLGLRIGLSESELDRLKLLISLHDIGKINIPEEILTKAEALSADDWTIIKKHPEIGYRIASATADFAHVADGILSHHERWDGTGYPRGVVGKEIPLLARIAAIADAYEVMSSGRPYKPALSHEEIRDEFLRCSGTQFDPELAAVFLQILEEEGPKDPDAA